MEKLFFKVLLITYRTAMFNVLIGGGQNSQGMNFKKWDVA